jgi:predicted  nucleic acid-binding Zn-ribbon protein
MLVYLVFLILVLYILYYNLFPVIEGMEGCDKEQLPIENAANIRSLKTAVDDVVEKVNKIQVDTTQLQSDVSVMKTNYAEFKKELDETSDRAKTNEERLKSVGDQAAKQSSDIQAGIQNNPPLK